jgi:hypothetical protein
LGGPVVAGWQVEVGARDLRFGLRLPPWRLAEPRVLVVERIDQIHCVLQIVKAMPLVMFLAPFFPSDEIARLVPSIDQDLFFPHNFLHVAFAVRLHFVLDCRLRVGCLGVGRANKGHSAENTEHRRRVAQPH